jgi:hypothetical protein
MAKLFEQWKAVPVPPLTHVNRLGHAMMFQSVIYGQAFRTIESGTAPNNPEPPGLCDDASGNYLLQRVLNK